VDDVLTDPDRLVLEIPPTKGTHELRLLQRRPVVVARDADDLAIERLQLIRERADDPLSGSNVPCHEKQVAGRDDGKHQAVQICNSGDGHPRAHRGSCRHMFSQ
jgi:hypothetical protein